MVLVGGRYYVSRLSVRLAIARLAISGLTVFWFRSTTHHRGVGVASFVAGSAIAAWRGGQFGVSSGVLVATVSFPEWSSPRAGGVVVGWGGAEALFPLVMADQEDLEDGCDEEEKAAAFVSQ